MEFQFICPHHQKKFSDAPETALKYAELWLKCGHQLERDQQLPQAIRHFGCAFESSWILANSGAQSGSALELLAESACGLAKMLARNGAISACDSVIARATKRVSRDLISIQRRSAIRALAKLCSFVPDYRPALHQQTAPKWIH